MTRTTVDIDDRACAEVMRRYRFASKREAINHALRVLAGETPSAKRYQAHRERLEAFVAQSAQGRAVRQAILADICNDIARLDAAS